jgi:threonylcarbamoyladenosine tRNA methylthiotransferase MtaB
MREILKTISFQTVGCRLNQYETEQMAAKLLPYGFQRVDGKDAADLYVINTCTVTHRADSDCRNLIRRAARQNPAGRIVVVGCYVEKEPERIAGMEGVDVIVRNREKSSIDTILHRQLPDLFTHEPDKSCSTVVSAFHDRNRAWVKISDGCRQKCSFCIVTIVRGELTNLPAHEIIKEISALVENGYHEVVLTGVNIGYYRDVQSDPPVRNLAALCRQILDETGVKRLRLSSVEPQSVSADLIATYKEYAGRICRHFHLPLQSGSNRILELMRRPYNQRQYIEKTTKLKEVVPETIIGADVIVGFPGETDEEFEKTRRLCDSGLLDYLHVFSYSDRPGTDSSLMPDKVDPAVIKERNTVLSGISKSRKARSYARHQNATLDVISEHNRTDDGGYWAVSDNYLRVKLPTDRDWGRRIVRFASDFAHDDHLTGRILTASF